ncbi:MAG: ribonuclease HII [Elusimicrobia bacterium]|nr:ribonuclease HII [Elusimicrobiota bacterium]
MERGKTLFYFDKKLATLSKNLSKKSCIIGIDEAGRGPWAGPVVASAICLSPDFFHPKLNDSKKCSPKLRLELYRHLQEKARWGLGVCEVEVIDSINILQATYRAMKTALEKLLLKHPEIKPDLILVDGRSIPNFKFRQKAIVKGDSKSAAIASASIIAKVERDKIMESLDKVYPQYGFARHKGYGTKIHQENLEKYGPCPIHRKSFAPVGKLLLSSC